MDELINQKESDRERMNRLRGWIIYIVYGSRPRNVDFTTLKSMLDRRGYPLSSHRLAKELSFLCGEDLVRVSRLGVSKRLNLEEDQDALLLRYMESYNADDGYCVSLRTRGVQFQEDNCDVPGVMRIG